MNKNLRHAQSLSTQFVWTFVALLLLGLSDPALAGMVWSARAIDPSQIDALKSNQELLESTLFGEQPPILTEHLKKNGQVNLADPQVKEQLTAWLAAHKANDTSVDLDKAWHGIHYLLTGSAEPNDTIASKVIFGGESIGRDAGYGPAQLLKPDEVKAIAQLLDATPPEVLQKRFKPEEMTRAKVYPSVIWVRDGDEALKYLLDNYKNLVAFYKRAAERGQAVIFALS
jgi:hypothetical protein